MIVCAVPVKDLVNAKQRLIKALAPDERMALALAMLRDVLRAAAAARLDALWVITRDDEVSAIVRALGAKVLGEPENRGHTAAVALAQQHAARAGAQVFLTIPGDVPLVTAEEIQALAAAAARPASAVFTPSRSRLGTNGVALAPPTVMPLEFGEPSFDNHLAVARQRGLKPEVLALPGLGVDIDCPEDLPVLLAEGAATESRRLLARWDVGARLAATAIQR